MRSRERLIEVLHTVNSEAIPYLTGNACMYLLDFLEPETQNNFREGRIRLAIADEQTSPYIRELLSEGLQILAAEKLVGGCRND